MSSKASFLTGSSSAALCSSAWRSSGLLATTMAPTMRGDHDEEDDDAHADSVRASRKRGHRDAVRTVATYAGSC